MAVWLALLTTTFLFTGKVTFVVLGTVAAALLLGQPLFVLMGTLGILLLATVSGMGSLDDLTVVVRKLLELASKEVLLAIPFFVVAGELMTHGSLARRLVDVMRSLFAWIPGGLAMAAVSGCVFFAAISGSSPVTVVAIGSIMAPALIKSRYPEDFSIGLLTTAGSLGILIPPSIPMIVYAIMVGASTPVDPMELFIAGILPGLMIGALLAGYSFLVGYRRRVPTEPFSWPTVTTAVSEGIWSLLLPIIILGGIYSGTFTATEAAAVSVLYALAVEVFIHKELDGKKLAAVAAGSMTVMGSLLVIIALAITLNYFLVLEGIPDLMVNWLKGLDLSRPTFLLLVNLLLLVVGCFMDIMSAILIIAPMLAPMANAMGIDPVHMGIIFIVNLEIGYLTPPVGLNLFVSSTLFKRSLGFVTRAVLPTLAIMVFGLCIVVWVPQVSLLLVEAVRKPPTAPAAVITPAVPPAGPARVKTLEELMREQRDGGASPSTTPPPPRVKTLEELMREARERGTE
ncbi:MAG: TRAP transporter large permease subunit [Deltaproteobacteria bacterium]|nr:TRAP transporter large permease subunit [Deltaproteobacteria bacterium]